jgi:TP901 family phage tail tape measure protein
MPAIGQAATATMSSISDLSAASVAAMQNMKVGPLEIARMLDAMASAGNAGAFEVRDMAKAFPALTASAQSLGITGVKGITDMAAALQVARRGAGDASTAANNMANFLQKLATPQTIKNFKKFGVDVTKELQKAHKKGISPIEHFIGLVDEKTKGGKADLLGQLFGDKQVLEFVRPMLADFKDYIRIRDEAEQASGTVADAYAKRMGDAEQKMKAFRIQMENLGTSLGATMLKPLGDFAGHLAYILQTLDKRVGVFDRIKAAIDGFARGFGQGDAASMFGSVGKWLENSIFGEEFKEPELADPNQPESDPAKRAAGYGRAIDHRVTELAKLSNRFAEIGRNFREFADAVAENPITKFLGEVAGSGFKLMLATVGLGILAGAVRKLGRALFFLSGASAAVSIIKTIASVGGSVLGGGRLRPGGNVPGSGTPKTSNVPKGAPVAAPMGAAGGLLGGMARGVLSRVPQAVAALGSLYLIGRGLAHLSEQNNAENRRLATPRDAERDSMRAYNRDKAEIDEMHEERRAQRDRNRPALPGAAVPTHRDAERTSMDSYRDAGVGFFNSPAWKAIEGFGAAIRGLENSLADRFGMRVNAPNAESRQLGPQAVLIQGIPTVTTQPTGIQSVRVTNPMPAPIINVTVHATTNANPHEIAGAVERSLSSKLAAMSGGAYSDGVA